MAASPFSGTPVTAAPIPAPSLPLLRPGYPAVMGHDPDSYWRQARVIAVPGKMQVDWSPSEEDKS